LPSAQLVPNTSADSSGTWAGSLVMILIRPATASLPYKVDAGPFTISTRSISAWGIPLSPYTVDRPLTSGIPSISTMVYGPSKPLIWMSPVLQILQLSCGLTPLMCWRASKMDGVGFDLKKDCVYTSTGTGLSSLETSFKVPETTTCSNWAGGAVVSESPFRNESTGCAIPPCPSRVNPNENKPFLNIAKIFF